jgi:hypothetical protein
MYQWFTITSWSFSVASMVIDLERVTLVQNAWILESNLNTYFPITFFLKSVL